MFGILATIRLERALRTAAQLDRALKRLNADQRERLAPYTWNGAHVAQLVLNDIMTKPSSEDVWAMRSALAAVERVAGLA